MALVIEAESCQYGTSVCKESECLKGGLLFAAYRGDKIVELSILVFTGHQILDILGGRACFVLGIFTFHHGPWHFWGAFYTFFNFAFPIILEKKEPL